MTRQHLLIFFVIFCFVSNDFINGSHFRGGIISWRPLNSTPSGSTARILLHQRYFFDRMATYFNPYPSRCTEAFVTGESPIPVIGTMDCLANCPTSTYSPISIAVNTTDCNTLTILSSWGGERYDPVILPLTTVITIGYTGNAWLGALYNDTNGWWAVVNRLNLALRPDGYINSSPVTTTLPVVLYSINVQIVHTIQMADNDGTDILQCRRANSNSLGNFNQVDECEANIYYACAVQIEDYYNSAATNPMSSVPIQFLFYGYIPSNTACSQRPQIIGDRPNRACIGVPIGIQLNETVIVQTYCPGQTIVDFITSSPLGMMHSPIIQTGAFLYTMTLTWTPIANQAGPQGFCAGAVDNSNLQSDPWCITYLVDYTSPDLIRPTVVQGSASPVGTVFANQSMFSIQATSLVGRPTRNGTNVCFNDAATNNTVFCYDAGYSANVIYTGYTIVIITNYTWTPGAFYYITMDSGFASGSVFCHAESTPIRDKTFWTFNIWNPAVSSTTTTTTTPFTTATVTTKPTSTTSINTLLTTTGIVITTTIPMTTNATTPTTTSTTTAAPTTPGPTISAATTESTVAMVYPQDFEDACKQTVAIMTTVSLVTFMPIHALIMYAAMNRFANQFNPVKIDAKTRHKLRMKRIRH
ncbi:unnamed protein product [Adineta ricciae]|uniref:Membrane-associated protein n=1 Tax=Adineta ricciae TaxID=249248 RepID=A0A815I737_ADIRI|nr:unnamed protein product [Adineta ricciae]